MRQGRYFQLSTFNSRSPRDFHFRRLHDEPYGRMRFSDAHGNGGHREASQDLFRYAFCKRLQKTVGTSLIDSATSRQSAP